MPIKTKSGKWKWGNVERDSKKELVQTVYGIWKKNGSKGSFSDFLKGTHESTISESTKRYAYHCTNTDPEIIKKEGWKVGDGFTLDNQFEDLYKKYLPKVSVFVSSLDVPVWDSKAKYCIKLDITGFKLFPDFGYLPDFGAYYDYDEECFYWENEDDLDSNKKLKDFVLNNCDNLTLYADCFDGEDSFNVLGTACVDGADLNRLENRGIVEFVDMKIGKRVMNESVISEDKTAMIKKLVLPDIKDDPKDLYSKRKNYKSILKAFFFEHPSYEKQIDWNKWKTLTSKDFDKVMELAKNSRRERKKRERRATGKDPKDLFKDVEGRKFKIIEENDNWIFVAPLNHKAAEFCDSKECGGGSAKWCIGEKDDARYWNQYIHEGAKFIMAFSKAFETMPEENLFTDLKYMFENNTVDHEFLIWDQKDDDAGVNIYETKFNKNREDFKKLFAKIDLDEYEAILFSVKNGVLETFYSGTFDEFTVPENVEEIGEGAAAYPDGVAVYSLVITPQLERIGQAAFKGVYMDSISFDDPEDISLELIDNDAFSYNKFAKIDLSKVKALHAIGDYAFSYNDRLKTVKLPGTLEEMGENVFQSCYSLRYLEIPEKFYDPENDFKELQRVCGNIEWDEIEIVPIDIRGNEVKKD